MYKIEFSEQASIDITYLKFYLKFVIKNPNYAESISTEIMNAIYSLDFSPERFSKIDIGPANIRRMPIKKYNIYYSVDKEKLIVTVIRILYSGIDINKVAIN